MHSGRPKAEPVFPAMTAEMVRSNDKGRQPCRPLLLAPTGVVLTTWQRGRRLRRSWRDTRTLFRNDGLASGTSQASGSSDQIEIGEERAPLLAQRKPQPRWRQTHGKPEQNASYAWPLYARDDYPDPQ